MSQVTVIAEREIGAPADVVYAILANYRDHHPHILPPAFSELHVEQGGVGAGTVISFTYRAGGRVRSFRDLVAEPDPGSVLTESDTTGRTDKVTTFTVTPLGELSRVRIETRWAPHGIEGLVELLFAALQLRPSMLDELDRLDRYAQKQAD